MQVDKLILYPLAWGQLITSVLIAVLDFARGYSLKVVRSSRSLLSLNCFKTPLWMVKREKVVTLGHTLCILLSGH